MNWIHFYRRRSLQFIFALNIGFFLLCILAGWPRWWDEIIYGKSALAWFASVELSWIAFVCWAMELLQQTGGTASPRLPWPPLWRWLGLAFFFLTSKKNFDFTLGFAKAF